MPPVNQGSRTGLLAWTVVAFITAVASIILAIYFYVDSNRVHQLYENQTKQYAEVLSREIINSPEMEALKALRSDPNAGYNSSMKLWDVAMEQRARLSKLISGSDDVGQVIGAAAAAIEKAKTSAGVTGATESLTATIDALVTEVNARKTEAANNKKDSEDSKQKLDQIVKATQGQIDSLTRTMESIRAEKDAALSELQKISRDQTAGFENTAAEMRTQLTQAQEQINQLNAQNAELASTVDKQKQEIIALLLKLGDRRVDPTRAIVQTADARIVRVPNANTVFINLGAGDHIAPGLTFEVYNQFDGIPAPGDPTNDENLPIGKASIEVIHVGPTSAECRVIRRSLGAGVIVEGDLAVNLVYDRNTRYNFVVHGNFDLDQNGVATVRDAEIIKRLITEWGGTVVDSINANTDFVVLGREPVIPDPPEPGDPVAQANYDRALAESESYKQISEKAREYRIPILNQNRFLYYVGYYSQARR